MSAGCVKEYCPKCGGTGKVDRGNGSTKPCDCHAGLIERARRKVLKALADVAKARRFKP